MSDTIHVYIDEEASVHASDGNVDIGASEVSVDDIGTSEIATDIVESVEADTDTEVHIRSIHTDTIRAVSESSGGGGSGGTNDYNELINKPQIEGVTLQGNKSFVDLTLISLTNSEIESICVL